MTRPSAQPWLLPDLTCLLWTVTTGAVAIFGAWVAASGSDRWSTQEAAVVVGIGGVVVATAGIAGWIQSGSRRVRDRAAGLQAIALARTPAHEGAPRAALVSGPAMTQFHRADCELVAGKSVRVEDRDAHLRGGRTPCRVCRP
jgi:hypothetical protein